jgi:hypothetical protein
MDTRLYQWREKIPEATSHASRVKTLLDFLSDKYNHKHENALVLFLRVVSESTALADICYKQLTELACDLEGVLGIVDDEGIVNSAGIAKYPCPSFKNLFREVIAPKRYINTNSILHIVFGDLSKVCKTTVVLPINQSFDFEQRGPRSVLAAFERLIIEGQYFYNFVNQSWPKSDRPLYAGLGNTKFLRLPDNGQSLYGAMFTVTTRNLTDNPFHYGRYVDTPLEGLDYVLDSILETAQEHKLQSLATPLLGAGYANIGQTFNSFELRQLLREIVLALTIQKFENVLTDEGNELKRGIIVIYSSEPQSKLEHLYWDFVVKFVKKNQREQSEQIDACVKKYAQMCSAG